MDKFADYISLAVAVHGVALLVVNTTPTPKDNEALDTYTRILVKVYRAIEILAGIVTSKAKH